MTTRLASRLLYGLLLTLLILVALLFAAGLVYRWWSLPKTSGTQDVPGLAAAVDVVRDGEGIPHIYAANAADAWFALGYVHAQDRLWQMTFNRRIAAGRLAEILGPSALPTDRYLRTLGVRANAEQQWLQQDAATKAVLQRYADGVNAYLAHRRGPLPPEFILTGAPQPEAWSPVDSLAWVTMMAWDLSGNGNTELLRMRLAGHLSKKQIDEFLPPYPGNDGVADPVLPTADYTALYKNLGALAKSMALANEAAPPGLTEGKGSNNWVVSGAHTQSGKPLLANDPHLALGAPSLWYLASITAPGLNVIGATVPGLPAVALGRNDHIAWGATNTAPDTQDFYIEETDGNKVKTPTGWQPLVTHQEIIHVKGQADEVLTVRMSRHGPLLSDVAGPAQTGLGALGGKHFALAFDWVALRPDDHTLAAFVKLNQADNWADFVTALSEYSSPQQNFVYADTDGNIGFLAPGRIPIRAADNDLMGQAPAPGWDARYDWTGFIAFDQLPTRFNPPSGQIVTANQKVVEPGYQPFLTAEWTPPYRAKRIEQLLASNQHHSIASFALLQADQTSLAEKELLPLLLQTAPSNNTAADALKRLASWDGKMDATRVEPSIYHAWLLQLAKLIEQDKLGEPLFSETWSERPVFLLNVLHNQDGQGRWCDDTRTEAIETCDELKTHALDLALADLTAHYGNDPRKWQWGRLHQARAVHAPFDHVAYLAPLFDLISPVGGDSETIDVGQFRAGQGEHPFAAYHAPSLRGIYDLSAPEQSVFIESTGESGSVLSPFYSNMEKRWVDVGYLPMQLERHAAEQHAQGVLHLLPAEK
jgi:penicillin amidase